MTHRIAWVLFLMSFFVGTDCRNKALPQTKAAAIKKDNKMMIVIKLSEDALNSDRNAASPIATKSKELTHLITKWGLILTPMHPTATDAPLTTYFNCALPEGETGEKMLDTLRKTAGVEAAYRASIPSLPKN